MKAFTRTAFLLCTTTLAWPSDVSSAQSAPANAAYQPNLTSLERHPLPQWYADAKLGVMVVWGIYSVPGWAPLVHKDHDFASQDFIKDDPYAEWYYNAMRVPGSPTEAYHREHFGANFGYYQFASQFEKESLKWQPEKMANQLKNAGVKYVVVTTKFHDGYMLWPTAVENPNQQGITSPRDITGELTAAVRKAGMRMGIYYSGGFDWTFDRGPVLTNPDYEAIKPQTVAYGDYAYSQMKELISLYHPAVLWNDIDWPKTGKPLQVIADYYNAVPDGVVDDRFGVAHADFQSPEYVNFHEIRSKKWEEVRGLGASFGYNRAEGEAETISPRELVHLLVDVVSKNGNLMLGVGPEADGSISPVQLARLQALGEWLKQNGEAIYGTKPWTRAEGDTGEALGLRFTQKDGNLYAILLDAPTTRSVLLHTVTARPDSQIFLLGDPNPISWKQEGADLRLQLPMTLPGKYAYSLRIAQP
ncbi:alpha-L-fucosidase [Granulicella pectinivorans]|uniref:alpha-L-fucosidase n=1 Tax=Granulicella pectinivorans TaxID=474950 RepID=A0A1I6L4G9_9BACT|nr:alpha-L-fucosidase [Granulicella pectinivorans]